MHDEGVRDVKREFASLEAFETFLSEKAEQQITVLNQAAGKSSDVLYADVHGLYGQHPPLAELAQATKDERAKIPGISTDEPLLRTGALLRDKVEKAYTFVEREGRNDVTRALVGSPEKINLYHEFGYINHRTGRPVPARPVFKIVAEVAGPQLAEMFSGETKRVWGS